MHILTRQFARSLAPVVVPALLPLCCALAVPAQQQDAELAAQGISTAQIKSWHENLKLYAPVEEGCFQTTFPLVQWTKVACAPRPAFVSGGPVHHRLANAEAAHGAQAAGAQTAGNGNDYAAQTQGITTQGTGSFPVANGVTSEKSVGVAAYGGGGALGSNEYTLQLNTDINPSATACSVYGYASCQVWEQFIYETAYQSRYGAVFIQNWIFPSSADYSAKGCPAGWNDYQGSCYKNSSATAAPNVSATKLGSVKLSGTTGGGKNTVIFTYGTTAYSASEPDSTVSSSTWWRNSEFNVVGNGGGSEAVFNSGVTLTVNLAVSDGTTNAPKCLSQAGTTGESNNLNLKACSTTGGSSPAISFTESN